MAYIAATRDVFEATASVPGLLRRLLSTIMEARQAQAQWRIAEKLRDLPDDVLQDIGLAPTQMKRLRGGQPPCL